MNKTAEQKGNWTCIIYDHEDKTLAVRTFRDCTMEQAKEKALRLQEKREGYGYYIEQKSIDG